MSWLFSLVRDCISLIGFWRHRGCQINGHATILNFHLLLALRVLLLRMWTILFYPVN